jgi:hypothetical protein
MRVLEAATARAEALAQADAPRLRQLLHPEFRWTSHTGDSFDRETYVQNNVNGATAWRSQSLHDPEVIVVGDTAVLRCTVTDVVEAPNDPGNPDGLMRHRMPMTQVWVRVDSAWQCLAGHAGPLKG